MHSYSLIFLLKLNSLLNRLKLYYYINFLYLSRLSLVATMMWIAVWKTQMELHSTKR